MALLLQVWLVLTAALSSVLVLVIGVQGVVRLVRRPAPELAPPAAQAEVPAADKAPLQSVLHVPAPRRAQAQDLLPSS